MAPMKLIPPNESERLKALRRYEILDTPPDGAFDRITELAAQLCDTPIAIVSLVDNDRIWFKSRHGLDAQEIDRDPGLCASAILGNTPYIVNDARIDPRTLANPLVASEFGLRFYAAAPLQTKDSFNLGTLCVIDFKPRPITAEQIQYLNTLSEVIVDEMELRLAARRIDLLNQQLQVAHDQLRIQATHDALTKLWNRGAMMSLLDKTIALSQRQNQPIGVALFDIDHFKQINDTYGHLVGDKVLVEVARRLKKTCRDSDGLGRVGGEEFLLLTYPCEPSQVPNIVERFLASVRNTPIVIDEDRGFSLQITMSAGVDCPPLGCTETMEEILNRADQRLYVAKRAGRNRSEHCAKIS